MTINILMSYGAGSDALFGGGLRWLQNEVSKNFKPSQVYLPRIVDWTEYNTFVRLLEKWKDPTILVGHSCGNWTITKAAAELSMEPIPYLMAIAPSIYCAMTPIPPNVRRATQCTSWWGDFFNPGAGKMISTPAAAMMAPLTGYRMVLRNSSINNRTVIDTIYTGKTHINAPYSELVRDRLFQEIKIALKGT